MLIDKLIVFKICLEGEGAYKISEFTPCPPDQPIHKHIVTDRSNAVLLLRFYVSLCIFQVGLSVVYVKSVLF